MNPTPLFPVSGTTAIPMEAPYVQGNHIFSPKTPQNASMSSDRSLPHGQPRKLLTGMQATPYPTEQADAHWDI